MKVEIINSDEMGHFIIKINEMIHLKFMCRINVVQSCVDETDKGTLWYIEWYLESGQTVKSTYNRKDLWEKILKGLG